MPVLTKLLAECCFPPRAIYKTGDEGPLVFDRTNCQRAVITLVALAELGLYIFLIQHSISTGFWNEHTWIAIDIASGLAVTAMVIFTWCHSRSKKTAGVEPVEPGTTADQARRLTTKKSVVSTEWIKYIGGGTEPIELLRDDGDGDCCPHHYYRLINSGDLYETSDKSIKEGQLHFGTLMGRCYPGCSWTDIKEDDGGEGSDLSGETSASDSSSPSPPAFMLEWDERGTDAGGKKRYFLKGTEIEFVREDWEEGRQGEYLYQNQSLIYRNARVGRAAMAIPPA